MCDICGERTCLATGIIIVAKLPSSQRVRGEEEGKGDKISCHDPMIHHNSWPFCQHESLSITAQFWIILFRIQYSRRNTPQSTPIFNKSTHHTTAGIDICTTSLAYYPIIIIIIPYACSTLGRVPCMLSIDWFVVVVVFNFLYFFLDILNMQTSCNTARGYMDSI